MDIIIILVIFLAVLFFVITNKKKKPSYSAKKFQEDSLKVVQNNTFGVQPILNNEERKIYKKIQNLLESSNSYSDLTLFVQTTLGELLTHKDSSKYRSIGCKRLDFCIVDKNFNPIIGVEYNGTGHTGNHSGLRDEIKKVALTESGIAYISIEYNEINKGMYKVEFALQKITT